MYVFSIELCISLLMESTLNNILRIKRDDLLLILNGLFKCLKPEAHQYNQLLKILCFMIIAPVPYLSVTTSYVVTT